jgi:PKD repeat protein
MVFRGSARAQLPLFVAMAVLFASPLALAVPANGIDCNCSKLGFFNVGVQPVELAAPASGGNPFSGQSTDHLWTVTAGPVTTSSPLIHFVITATGSTVPIREDDATFWGFSPDSRSFAAFYIEPGTGFMVLKLYNLGSSPGTLVRTFTYPNDPHRILFSPHGKYLFLARTTMVNQANLQMVDVTTGAFVLNKTFNFQHQVGVQQDPGCWPDMGPPPVVDAGAPADPDAGIDGGLDAGDDAGVPAGVADAGWGSGPCIMDGFGLVAWGFSPDALDRTFLYNYVTSPTQYSWNVVNLVTLAEKHDDTLTAAGFSVISPCGDMVARIQEPFSSQFQPVFLVTQTMSFVTPAPSMVLGLDVFIDARATSHVAVVGGTTALTEYTMVPNTAGQSCTAPPPGNPPVAAFTPPSVVWARRPATFFDQSSFSSPLATWSWDFGDSKTASTATAPHTFADAGTYQVALTVVDSDGRPGTVSHPVVVGVKPAPVANFDWTPLNPVAGAAVTLMDRSTDVEAIPDHLWDFPPEAVVISRTPDNTQLVLKLCQTSDISLTAVDWLGQRSTKTQTVVVTPKASTIIDVPSGGSLADAVAIACPGDTIKLAAGSFAGDVVLDRVHLEGAGAGLSIVHGGVRLDSPAGFLQHVSKLTVADSSVAGLRVLGDGTGVLEDLEVTNNLGSGVGAYNHGSVELRRSHVHHNQGLSGAGITAGVVGTVIVEDCEIDSNTATDQGGGADIGEVDILYFRRNYVHHNTAGFAGGAALYTANDWDVSGNRFAFNTAANGAGGVSVQSLDFAGNLVAHNTGGGVYAWSAELVNCTIADNIGRPGVDGSPTAVRNSLVFGNHGADGGPADLGGYLQSNSLVGSSPCFSAAGDYHLMMGSPAIDTGDNSVVPAYLTKDLDGTDRIQAGVVGGPAIVDMGAYEFVAGTSGGSCAAPDAGVDAGAVAEVDAGVDAGAVVEVDAGVDAGADDGGPVLGEDAGLEADGGSDVVPDKPGCGGCASGAGGVAPLLFAFALVPALRRRRRAQC